jgi:hypothetical protein
MANINDQANNLDASLRRSTQSARLLSMAISTGNQNLFAAVQAAGQLAEGLAAASRVAKLAEMATGFGIIVTLLGTAAAATVMWKDAQKEIESTTANIHSVTRALNVEASNMPKLARERLAEEIRVTAEKQKQLDAIDREDNFLLGLGKKIHDRSAEREAIEEQARAKMRAFDAERARREQEINTLALKTVNTQRVGQGLQADIELARAGFGIQGEGGRFRTPFAFRSQEEQARELLRLERAQALREATENLRDQKVDEGGIDSVLIQIERQFSAKAIQLEQSFIRPLGDQLGRSFASSIADGIAAGIQEGSIGKGFRVLLGGMLQGLGSMMVQIGTESLLFARLFDSIVTALRSFAPAGAIGPSLLLIAGGAALQGVASALTGGGGGGGGGSGGGGAGSSSGATIIDRGLINPANGFVTSPGIITPNPGVTQNIFWVAMDDPRVQRDLLTTIDRGRMRRGDR